MNMSDVDTMDEMDAPLRVNLAGVATGFEVLPAGTYRMSIEEWERTVTKGGKTIGAPLIKWTLSVSRGEFQGRKLFSNNTFSAGALPFFKEFLLATGRFTPVQLNSDNFDVEDACNEALDAEVMVTVQVKPYDGEDTNRIRRFRPVGDGTGDAASIDDIMPDL